MRVAFLMQSPWLETLAFVREPIMEFARSGAQIDVFMPLSKNFPKPDFEGYSNIKIIETNFSQGEADLLRALARVVVSSVGRPYDLFFATPVYALVVAARASRLMSRPLVSLCDEIPELVGAEQLQLANAYEASDLCVITDHTRVPLLKQSLGGAVRLPQMLELPNCAANEGRPPKLRRLPARPVRVLSLGFFDRAFGADLIIDSLLAINPIKVRILVHERSNQNHLLKVSSSVFKLLTKAYPIDFHMAPVAYGNIPSIVDNFDIGLALYTSQVSNDRYCGKGSGKLARYLQQGLPVIVSGPNLRWLEDYGAGKHVDSGEELAHALNEICADYEMFSAKAIECYEEHFMLEKFMPPLKMAIDALIESYNPARIEPWEAWVTSCSDVASRLEGRIRNDTVAREHRFGAQLSEELATSYAAEHAFIRAIAGFEPFGAGFCSPDDNNALQQANPFVSFTADLANKALDYSGIDLDGWLSDYSTFVLRSWPHASQLTVRGQVPLIDDSSFLTALTISINGEPLAQSKLTVGSFEVVVDAPGGLSWCRIELTFSDLQRLPDPDGRMVGAKLDSIGFDDGGKPKREL